ncbi:RHS repeat domain-containing protein [Xenorhabdus kozodoii]|uniref:RhsA protein in rhs element n=1 Tax=Xenorhabdus kozodoii TaxID=351676 RepID=A0A2D0LE37_9GAMM|nr:RHS repeat-associated core domain-containing protein [Xenorhabdus kozodoii]PHM70683.1 rhsA protein in rhs element [Xenorhabdus kozodoii]PHM73920.1 rhsA protein in rhs element [Xenorhabdus kozodoii]
MSDNFFSQAANFQSTATGQVDPRTGLFNYAMPLAHLIGNNQLGPEQTFALSYSPLNSGNIGFGIGFSLGLTHYNAEHRLLMLSTGEQYKVFETDERVFLKQYKQDVIRFEKDVEQNVYRVIHKSGQVEILTGPRNLYDLKVPTHIINPLGCTLTLDWDYGGKPIPRLVSVSDESQVLLKIQYHTAIYTRIMVWPDTPESYVIRLNFENDRVTQIHNESGDQTLSWKLGYDSGSGFLTRISSPTGMTEFVNYDLEGHDFPSDAHLPPLPYVTRHTQQIKPGSDIIRDYEYTEYNFLGYGSHGSWNENDDYLYGVLTNYHYGSTEHWNNGTEQRHITRRYNNYHLLISENAQQNSCQRQHKTKYYAHIGQSFDNQPPQFQLPQSATVRFISDSGQREEVTQTEFDAAGNPTVQVAPDGTRTEWVYYPAEGETDQCPADPHGFVRYVKSKTVTPAPTAGYNDAPVHHVRYRYETLSTRSGSPNTYAVVCTRQEMYSGSQLLQASQTHYVDQPDQPHHGRVALIEETVYSAPDNRSTDTLPHWTSQTRFSYSLTDGELQNTVQWCGHDGLTVSGLQVTSCVSGKLLRGQDPLNCTAHYTYDALGRLLKQEDNAGTDYARDIQFTYTIEENNVPTTTQQDVWGNQTRTRFNGKGQPYQKEILAKGQEAAGWRQVSGIERDSWGRAITKTYHDWLPTETDPEKEAQVRQVSVRQQTTYNNWGQPCLVTDDTGKRLRQEYDPVTLTTRHQMEADGLSFSYTETVYDLRHQPLTVTQYDSQGQPASQQQNDYDGLGRLRATVDALGQKTEYGYDAFNRVSVIQYSDGTVVRKSYAPFSVGALLTQIEADGKVLGIREFDSLHRVISTTVSDRTHRATYQANNPAPIAVTDAQGQTSQQQHEPRLGNALLQMITTGIQQNFTYEAKTGAMVRAVTAQQAVQQLNYTPDGQLQQESVRFDDTGAGAARNAEYRYSPAGRLTEYRGFSTAENRTQRLRFDTLGRPVEMADEALSVTFSYDAASRLNRWTVQDKKTTQQLMTTLKWDDFGRETERRIESDTDILTLTQTYTVIGQIASRATHSQQAGLLRQESYTYDPARRWLTDYQCTGSECPRDAYGMTLTRQQFTYDRLGNILTCITTLADGSSDTATFSYSPSDACQLQRITHTHPGYPAEITLAYDKNGRLIRDEAGRELTYDALGQLTSATLNENTCGYGYDAAGRLALQRLNDTQTQELYYWGNIRVMEVLRESGTETHRVQANGVPAATVTDSGTHLLGTDQQGSVLVSLQHPDTLTRYRYTPYGQQATNEQDPAQPAYTGEAFDPVGGGYHLGNGYRTYNPVLMRFTAPDSLSPFGAGGLNPYAYCLGDPINRSDPSGHISLGSILGIVFGTIGLVIGLAMAIPTGGASLTISGAILAGIGFLGDATGITSAAMEESNPQASAVLGWVSLSLGALSLGSGLLGGLARGMRQTGERLTESFSHGLSGRGAEVAGSSHSYTTAGSLTVRETEYVRSFRQIKNQAGRDIVETIGNSQINNIEINLDNLSRSIANPYEYQSTYGKVLKLGFWETSSGSNIWRIDNSVSVKLFTEQSTHVNITDSIYLRLYAQFITDDTAVTHVTNTNTIRSLIDYNFTHQTPFDEIRMSQILQLWGMNNYRGMFKDWAAADLLLRFPHKEQIIQEVTGVISLNDPLSYALLYNILFPN